MYLQRRERPEPEWVISLVRQAPYSGDQGPNTEQALKLRLANAGDGPAFQIEVEGTNCTHLTFANDKDEVQTRTALMPAGDSIIFWVMALVGDLDRVRLTLRWTDPPTRLRRRRELTFAASEVIAGPVLMPPTKRWWRRERRSLPE
jgi:hypothetical protein